MTSKRPETSHSRLSYANVVATVALFAALGGGAYAAAKAPKNTVTSKSVVDESLTGKDVKSDSLSGSDIAELSGADLDESSLSQVPNAATAAGVAANSITGASVQDNSLGGADVDESSLNLPAAPNETTPISARFGPNTGFQTLFEGNGIRLEGDCASASGALSFQVDALEPGVLQRALHFDAAPAAPDPTILSFSGQANDVANVGIGVNGESNSTIFWRRASDGKTVTISLGATSDNAAVGLDCVYAGSAIVD